MRVLTIQKEKDSNRHQKQNIITLQENKQLKFRLLGKKGISFLYLTKCFRICFPESCVKPVNGFDQEVKMFAKYLT